MAIQELRQEYSLAMLLENAQLPRATFYYHLQQEKCPTSIKLQKMR